MNKEKKFLYVLGGVLLVVTVGMWFLFGNGNEEPKVTAQENTLPTTGEAGLTKSSAGDVSVDLTPQGYAEGMFSMKIEINTHTVNDLDQYNLKEITTLVYQGKEYQPQEAPALAGHHTTGTLRFSLPEEPDQFNIIIEGLDAIGQREFTWP